MSYVVIIGNPVDGVTLHGPFGDPEDAAAWAEWHANDNWMLAELKEPKEEAT